MHNPKIEDLHQDRGCSFEIPGSEHSRLAKEKDWGYYPISLVCSIVHRHRQTVCLKSTVSANKRQPNDGGRLGDFFLSLALLRSSMICSFLDVCHLICSFGSFAQDGKFAMTRAGHM